MTRPHKYGARKVTLDGHTFDSAAEAKRYGELRLLEKAGEIADLQLQPKFPLHVNGEKVATYNADFRYVILASNRHPKRIVIEDVKGVKTPVYRLKKKLVKAIYGIEVEEVSA